MSANDNSNITTQSTNKESSKRNSQQVHNTLLDSPIRGPTLSTSTSSFEALDPHDPNLSKLGTKMFRKTEEYITNELQAPLEDYQLLENMNRATIAKYSDMRQISQNLSVSTSELSQKFQDLVSITRIVSNYVFINLCSLQKPLMQQIDEISDTVDKLEAAAYKLDAYSIALENRVKTVLQRKTNM